MYMHIYSTHEENICDLNGQQQLNGQRPDQLD